MIDDRTPNLDLPLPHPDNFLDQDVPRLRQALSKLDSSVGQVEALSAEAQNAADVAQVTANTAQATANTALGTANTAYDAANQAIAGASDAQGTAGAAYTLATNAQNTANTANSAANTAQTTANSAQTTANNAQNAFSNLSAPLKQLWQWSDPGDLPSYLWGSSDGQNHRVYPPSRLNVNYANNAGYAASAGWAPNSGAPIPNNTPGTVGYWVGVYGGVPAGGTWAVIALSNTDGQLGISGSVVPGGGYVYGYALAWRIA